MAPPSPPEPAVTLLLASVLCALCYVLTARLVPLLGPNLAAKGLGGYDMLKPTFKRDEDLLDRKLEVGQARKATKGREAGQKAELIPEATGVIGAAVYILLLSLFFPLPYLSHLLPNLHPPPFPLSLLPTRYIDSLPDFISSATSADVLASVEHGMDGSLAFPHHSLATYLASLLSLLMAVFLGFMDDLFDIRWRFKLPIPVIASIPLLVTYAAGQGITDVVLPKVLGLRALLGAEATSGVVRLGPLYYVYMSMLSTFCTNSINILAGVNGVEVGQALVISLSVVINDLLYLSLDLAPLLGLSKPLVVGMGLARGSTELTDRHLFSLYFMLPLVGVCAGLLRWNWFPASAFVGDTFCYFAGMAFAVVGILGHFSKTLLLFFLPQIFNFVYSAPQLFGALPCPRHRLPRLNASTGLLEPSYAPLGPTTPTLGKALVRALELLGLVHVKREGEGQGANPIGVSNLTILNLILVKRGPMTEQSLTSAMLAVQVAGSALAMAIRYGGAGLFYDAASRR